jgi:hypothetical protein
MMATVYLDFVAPNEIDDIVKLHIYEGPTVDGPFAEIEEVTEVGTPGSYISFYETDQASDENNWFSIRWETSKGGFTPTSEAIQGNARTAVAELTSRVMLRDPMAEEAIVVQESEAVLEEVFGTTDVPPDSISSKQYSGMTLLVLARIQLYSFASSSSGASSGGGWTAGLVSMKSDSSSSTSKINDFNELINQASRLLGLTSSRVAQMIPPEIALGLSEIVSADISRLQIEVE